MPDFTSDIADLRLLSKRMAINIRPYSEKARQNEVEEDAMLEYAIALGPVCVVPTLKQWAVQDARRHLEI